MACFQIKDFTHMILRAIFCNPLKDYWTYKRCLDHPELKNYIFKQYYVFFNIKKTIKIIN